MNENNWLRKKQLRFFGIDSNSLSEYLRSQIHSSLSLYAQNASTWPFYEEAYAAWFTTKVMVLTNIIKCKQNNQSISNIS